MSSVAQAVVLAGAVVTALGIISGGILWLIKPRFVEFVTKVNETHTQITQNGHRDPNNVTMRDLIGDIKREQAATNRRLDDHILVAEADSAELTRVKRHLGI